MKKNRKWESEVDYRNKLNKGEKEWLRKFNNEFHDDSGTEATDQPLHNTPELQKECGTRNNQANRDVFAIQQCKNVLVELDMLDNSDIYLGGSDYLYEAIDLTLDYNYLITRKKNREPMKNVKRKILKLYV